MLISEDFATSSSKQSRHGVELQEVNNERENRALRLTSYGRFADFIQVYL